MLLFKLILQNTCIHLLFWNLRNILQGFFFFCSMLNWIFGFFLDQHDFFSLNPDFGTLKRVLYIVLNQCKLVVSDLYEKAFANLKKLGKKKPLGNAVKEHNWDKED